MDRVPDVFVIDVQGYPFALDDLVQILVLMAGQAEPVGKALLVIDAPDVMRLVTIDADRNLVRLLFPQLATDDFQMYLLDLSVTLHTGGRDVVAIDAGLGVLMRQDVVRRVTTGAHSGDNQASPVEAVTMDGLRIILEDVVLAYRTELGDFRSFLVARSTKGRNVHHVRSSILIAGRTNIVFSMTGGAVGRQVSSLS
jgi:hypothetical protein